MLRRSTDCTGRTSRAKGRIAGAAAVLAAATGLLAANATPAFAGGYWETQTDGATGVSAWGTSTRSGGSCDVSMHITDTRGDGHRAGVQVQRVDFSHLDDITYTNYYRYNTSGSGTTVDRSVWDIPTATLEIEVYVREFVSEGAIESGGHYVDRGDWERIC